MKGKILRKHPKWMIIVGTNRNAGKTTFACEVIKKFSPFHKITAVKISPHIHQLDPDDQVIAKTDQYVIVNETKHNTGKDSSRMLDAGATKVYYVQVWDNNLDRAMTVLLEHIDRESLVVCESGRARSIIDPGVFLVIHKMGEPDSKSGSAIYAKQADRRIDFNGASFDMGPGEIGADNEGWYLLTR